MVDSGDIGSIARWIVGQLAARGYGHADMVSFAVALLEEVSRDLGGTGADEAEAAQTPSAAAEKMLRAIRLVSPSARAR